MNIGVSFGKLYFANYISEHRGNYKSFMKSENRRENAGIHIDFV